MPLIAVASAANVTAPTAAGARHRIRVLVASTADIVIGTLTANGAFGISRAGGGFNADADYVADSVDDNTDGTPRTVDVEFTPPGGAWDSGDNDTYWVFPASGAVENVLAETLGDDLIGTFTVAIPVLDELIGRYASYAGITRRYGIENVRKWSQLDSGVDAADADNISAAIADADDWIDRALRRAGYAPPVTDSISDYSALARAADEMAGVFLFDARGATTDKTREGQMEKRRLRAEALLLDLIMRGIDWTRRAGTGASAGPGLAVAAPAYPAIITAGYWP